MQYQIEDYLYALESNREPLLTGQDGRRTVELFTGVYRSSCDNMAVMFPLKSED